MASALVKMDVDLLLFNMLYERQEESRERVRESEEASASSSLQEEGPVESEGDCE